MERFGGGYILVVIEWVTEKNVPLTLHLGPAQVRWMCIPRYPQIQILNGSLIPTLERTEAEKRYVSMVSHMLLMLSQQQQQQQDDIHDLSS